MSWLTRLGLRQSGEREANLDEEVRFHLEMETNENIKRGMTPEQARNRALQRFGGVEQIKEQCRDAWGPPIRGGARSGRAFWLAPSPQEPGLLHNSHPYSSSGHRRQQRPLQRHLRRAHPSAPLPARRPAGGAATENAAARGRRLVLLGARGLRLPGAKPNPPGAGRVSQHVVHPARPPRAGASADRSRLGELLRAPGRAAAARPHLPSGGRADGRAAGAGVELRVLAAEPRR
jgi:hypothetical protein